MREQQTTVRPYPGLRPFEPWEHDIFFGRDAHIDRLQDILKQQHFLAVTGPSGSGKSSLVRAGLLPILPLGAIGSGCDWRIAILRPGEHPITRLARALSEDAFAAELATATASQWLTSTAGDAAPPLPANTPIPVLLEAELRRGPLGLRDLVQDIRQYAPHPDFNLLLLVDQFEEIFTYADAGTRQADESDAFVDLLLSASQNRDARIFVVLTLRTDFLGACTRFQGLPEAISDAFFLTPRLARGQLAEAIAGPVSYVGGDMQAELVSELVNAAGGDPDQLPLLQHALARLWEQVQQQLAQPGHAGQPMLRLEDFEADGELGTVLSRHGDAVYVDLTDAQKQDAQWLFRAITEQRSAEAGGQMVRRPLSLQRIAAWSERSWTDFVPILQAYADPRVSFLTYSGQPGEPGDGADTVIDITHEAVIRQWSRLKDWVGREAKASAELREWLERARRYSENLGALLVGEDLNRASHWLQQGLDFSDENKRQAIAPHTAWASRYSEAHTAATDYEEVKSYIEASGAKSRLIKRSLYSLAAMMFMLAVGLGWFGLDRYQISVTASAQRLWFSFNQNSTPCPDDVFTLSHQHSDVRLSFIEQILHSDPVARTFSRKPGIYLKAALQADLDLRSRAIAKLNEVESSALSAQADIARVLALLELNHYPAPQVILDAIQKSTDSDQLEPPRILWRLQLLRRWSHEKVQQVLSRSSRARRAYGAGTPQRLSLPVGGDRIHRRQNRLCAAHAARMGEAARDRYRPARRRHPCRTAAHQGSGA